MFGYESVLYAISRLVGFRGKGRLVNSLKNRQQPGGSTTSTSLGNVSKFKEVEESTLG